MRTTVPAATQQAAQHHLIGRDRELDELARRLAEARFVTVTGPPGVGKTRLVEAWVATLPTTSDAFLCRLADRTAASELVSDVARFLGVTSDDGDLSFRVERVAFALRAAGALTLVLDNFEQLERRAANIVASWIHETSDLNVIVTSRHRLDVPDEVVLRLEPLAAQDAGLVFRRAAERIRPGSSPAELDVTRVVAACDGLPLALELAASRLVVMGLTTLEARLDDDRLHVLRDIGGHRETRHAGLDRAFEWSWDLLEPWAKSALCQLACFRDAFDVASAEAVLDLSAHPDAPGALDVVQLLVDRSLVTRGKSAAHLCMLAVIRELARERAPPGLVEHTLRRHARFYATRCGATNDLDFVNLQFALEAAPLLADEPVVNATIASAVAHRLIHEGRFREAVHALAEVSRDGLPPSLGFEIAFLRARAHGAAWQPTEALAACDDAERLAGDDHDAFARAALERARVHWQDSDFGAAHDAEVLALARLAKARPTEPVLAVRAGHLLTQGLLGEREAAYRAMGPLLHATARLDTPEIAGLCEMAGLTAFMLGRPERAVLHFRDGSRRAARHGDRATAAWLDGFEAAVMASVGDIFQGQPRHADALARLERYGRSWHIGHTTHFASLIALRVGNFCSAADHLARAELLARSMPHPKLLALLANTHALRAWLEDRPDVAAAHADGALAYLGARRDPDVRAWFLTQRAVADAGLGHIDAAKATLAAVAADRAAAGPSLTRARLDLADGEIALAAGHHDSAEAALVRALSETTIAHQPARAPAYCLIDLWLLAARLEARLPPAARRRAWERVLDPRRQTLLLDAGGAWLRPPGAGSWMDLGARKKVVDVWQSLLRAHRAGRIASVETLRDEAWPGEAMTYEAGRNRVYAAIAELRRRGLDAVITRDGEGYKIAADIAILSIPANLAAAPVPPIHVAGDQSR